MARYSKVIDEVERRTDKTVRLTFIDGTQQTIPAHEIHGGMPRRGDHWYVDEPDEFKPGEPNPLLNNPVTATPVEIPAHIQRMLDEKAELDERIAKLIAFIRKPTTPGAFGFANLPEFERVCMYTQLNHMQGYSATLGLRLANAGF